MKKTLAFICMFALPCFAWATDLSGTITDRTGRGAQGATVTISCGEYNKTVTPPSAETIGSRMFRTGAPAH